MITAGIAAIAHFTSNTTIDQKWTLISVTTTSCRSTVILISLMELMQGGRVIAQRSEAREELVDVFDGGVFLDGAYHRTAKPVGHIAQQERAAPGVLVHHFIAVTIQAFEYVEVVAVVKDVHIHKPHGRLQI